MAGDDLEDQLDYSFDVGSPDSPVETVAVQSEDEIKEKTQNPKAETATPASKRKNKKNDKKKEFKRQQMEAKVERTKQLGTLESAMIADFIASKVSSLGKNLSAIEIQDKSVPQSSIVDTSSFELTRNIRNIAKYVQKFDILEEGELSVILHISALRACDTVRALKPLKTHVGKLIPKNKPVQDKELLAKKPKLVTATPGRITRLVKENIIAYSDVKNVIVEGSFIDQKANSVWDLAETVTVVRALAKGGAKVYVY